jgi:hypothetical protein
MAETLGAVLFVCFVVFTVLMCGAVLFDKGDGRQSPDGMC